MRYPTREEPLAKGARYVVGGSVGLRPRIEFAVWASRSHRSSLRRARQVVDRFWPATATVTR